MFPASKLRELSPRTRLRKISRILQGIEVVAAGGHPADPGYLLDMLRHMGEGVPAGVKAAAAALSKVLHHAHDSSALTRGVNGLRHAILSALHAEPAEWDLVNPRTGLLDRSDLSTLPMVIYLEDVRSPFNVGSIFRTAEAFGARRILISPRTPLPSHPRALRTSLGASTALPWEQAELTAVESMVGVFALELGGTSIDRFTFPRIGIVLVGSEELGLSPDALRLADAQYGRVSIPLGGAKRSLNVSVAFGILMHAWHRALTQRAQ
ncbi:MAG: TrmH family RNA methyltransferase [Spirochaetia bacterium]|jgi:TrmH family RNA methyltransferase